LTFLKGLLLLCGDIEENPGPEFVGHIGRALIIDYLGSVESISVAHRLEALNFEVKTDIRRIQKGLSCGYNAASIVAKIDFLHRTECDSWWDSVYDDCVFTTSNSTCDNQKISNMIKEAHKYLERVELEPQSLESGEVAELVGFYKSYFDLVPEQSTNENVYNWISLPMGPSQFDRLVKRLHDKYSNPRKKGRDEKFRFCVVNTHDGQGYHWYVVALQLFKTECSAEVCTTKSAEANADPRFEVNYVIDSEDELSITTAPKDATIAETDGPDVEVAVEADSADNIGGEQSKNSDATIAETDAPDVEVAVEADSADNVGGEQSKKDATIAETDAVDHNKAMGMDSAIHIKINENVDPAYTPEKMNDSIDDNCSKTDNELLNNCKASSDNVGHLLSEQKKGQAQDQTSDESGSMTETTTDNSEEKRGTKRSIDGINTDNENDQYKFSASDSQCELEKKNRLKVIHSMIEAAIIRTKDSQYYPLCICAVSYIYSKFYRKNLVKSDTKAILDSLPEYFGFFRDQSTDNKKNGKRRLKTIAEFAHSAHREIFDASSELIDLTRRHAGYKLVQGQPCEVCYQDNSCSYVDDLNKSVPCTQEMASDSMGKKPKVGESMSCNDSSDSRINEKSQTFEEKLIHLVSQEIEAAVSGPNADDMLRRVFACLVPFLASKYPKEKANIELWQRSFDHGRPLLVSIKNNLTLFEENLRRNARFLWYGLRLSHEQVKKVCRLLLCKISCPLRLEDKAKKLHKVEHISSELPGYSHSQVVDEYLTSLKVYGKEPNFSKLGKKFRLKGRKMGDSRQNRSKLSQAVIFKEILSDPDKYEGVKNHIDLHVSNHRRSYSKFPISGEFGIFIPRETPKKAVNAEIKKMIAEEKILVGTLHMPTVYYSYNVLKNETAIKQSHIRKIRLLKIRQKMLDKHFAAGVLKEHPDEYYAKMNRASCLQALSEYNVLYDDASTKGISLDSLRKTLKSTERTRMFAVWYDHATILGYSMLVFTFTCLYTANAYKDNGSLTGRMLQNMVEFPELYMVGYSKSTVEASELLAEYRRPDCTEMAIPVSTTSGTEYKDIIRAFFGDQPTRTDEASSNRSGNFRMSNLILDLRERLSFAELLSVEHLNLQELQKRALKGNFFGDASNIGKNLQEHISLQLAKLRGISRIGKTEKETLEDLYKDLAGIKNVPIILKNKPTEELSTLNMEFYEIQPYEPLHDGKETIKISLSIIPGKSLGEVDQPLYEKLSPIIARLDNDLYRLKSQKSGETMYQMLIDIVHELQTTFCLNNNNCRNMCGALFTSSTQLKCIQCLVIRYYRCLVEIISFSHAAEDRRNVHRVCRAYGLTYILYNTLLDLRKHIPDLEADKLLGSVHFIDIIYYFPLMHELHNILSFHAGRHESMFKQIKDIALHNTNRHVTSDNFTLQILIRLSQEGQFNEKFGKTGLVQSMASKKLSKLFSQFPPEKLVFTHEILNDSDSSADISKLFERLSNFIVSNNDDIDSGNCYFTMDEHNAWIINMPECLCFTEAQSSAPVRCPQCHVTKLPPYNISNLLTSDISRLIKGKAKIFESIRCQNIIKGIRVGKSTGSFAQKGAKPSIEVLSSVHVHQENEAHEKFKPTLQSMSLQLDSLLHDENNKIDFKSLINNPLLKCMAKIMGDCGEEIKKIDRKEGYRLGHDPKSDTFYQLKRQFIRYLYHAEFRIFEKLNAFEQKIKIACTKLDSMYLECDENESLSTNKIKALQIDLAKKELERLQKVKLIGANIVEYMEELINTNHMCVFDLERKLPRPNLSFKKDY
jgi:hypothetical protein